MMEFIYDPRNKYLVMEDNPIDSIDPMHGVPDKFKQIFNDVTQRSETSDNESSLMQPHSARQISIVREDVTTNSRYNKQNSKSNNSYSVNSEFSHHTMNILNPMRSANLGYTFSPMYRINTYQPDPDLLNKISNTSDDSVDVLDNNKIIFGSYVN